MTFDVTTLYVTTSFWWLGYVVIFGATTLYVIAFHVTTLVRRYISCNDFCMTSHFMSQLFIVAFHDLLAYYPNHDIQCHDFVRHDITLITWTCDIRCDDFVRYHIPCNDFGMSLHLMQWLLYITFHVVTFYRNISCHDFAITFTTLTCRDICCHDFVCQFWQVWYAVTFHISASYDFVCCDIRCHDFACREISNDDFSWHHVSCRDFLYQITCHDVSCHEFLPQYFMSRFLLLIKWNRIEFLQE